MIVRILIVLLIFLIIACSNSDGIDYANYTENADYSDVSSDEGDLKNLDASSSSTVIDYLPLDDSEYPYAGIPRIVIETENFREIKDRETEIPAKLQIWGEKAPESEVMDLTIRGRGNSSWTSMAKKSYKIELLDKHSLLGMPADRDWALISNHADKTLMRNYIIYKVAPSLGARYTPRCQFAEFFLNGEYLGVYLLVETIKIGKNRINIPKNENSYVVEFDNKYRDSEQVFFSNILEKKQPFRIHYPQSMSDTTINVIDAYIRQFEVFLKKDLLKEEKKLRTGLMSIRI